MVVDGPARRDAGHPDPGRARAIPCVSVYVPVRVRRAGARRRSATRPRGGASPGSATASSATRTRSPAIRAAPRTGRGGARRRRAGPDGRRRGPHGPRRLTRAPVASPREPPRARDQPVPAPARRQPGRLVPVGRGGARPGRGRGQADPAVGRLLVVPLVPRDGARVVRGRRDRGDDEPPLREREGRPRGAARHRRRLHGRGAGAHRPRRLADDRVPRARRPPVLRRHLLPARRPQRHARVRPDHGRGRRRVGQPARRGQPSRPTSSSPRSSRTRSPAGSPTSGDDLRFDVLDRAYDGVDGSCSTRSTAGSAARRSSRRR